MADPEIPEVRAELQREDARIEAQKSGAAPEEPQRLGGLVWLWWGFVIAVIVIIVAAYALG